MQPSILPPESILILVFLNVYANFFSQKPFMVKKPNPNAVLDIFNNQINKKFFLHGIDEKINNSDVIKKKFFVESIVLMKV